MEQKYWKVICMRNKLKVSCLWNKGNCILVDGLRAGDFFCCLAQVSMTLPVFPSSKPLCALLACLIIYN